MVITGVRGRAGVDERRSCSISVERGSWQKHGGWDIGVGDDRHPSRTGPRCNRLYVRRTVLCGVDLNSDAMPTRATHVRPDRDRDRSHAHEASDAWSPTPGHGNVLRRQVRRPRLRRPGPPAGRNGRDVDGPCDCPTFDLGRDASQPVGRIRGTVVRRCLTARRCAAQASLRLNHRVKRLPSAYSDGAGSRANVQSSKASRALG
jgi:hypothetical protein